MEEIKKYQDPAYTEEVRRIKTGVYERKRKGKRRGPGSNYTPPKKKRKK